MSKKNYFIQARCRTTGNTVTVTKKMIGSEAEAWRPTNNDRVKYKYFRVAEMEEGK